MKNREFHIFEEETELPDVVLEKMDSAFRQIQACPDGNRGTVIRLWEENTNTAEYRKEPGGKRTGRFKRTATAALCAALLAAGILTAAAATYTHWSRGMKGALQASPQQQMELEDKKIAIVPSEDTDTQNFTPVTDNGVTVCPSMTIATDDCAWISFSVDGFVPENGLQPDFGTFDVYFDNEPDSDKSRWRNITARFYDGTVINEDAQLVYDDGTIPDGSVVPRYADQNGTMEFIIQMSGDVNTNFLGQSLHVRLKDLGTVAQARFTKALEGTWEFTIPLPDSDAYRTYTAASAVGDTGITVKQLELSPVSVRATLSVPEQTEFDKELVSDMTHPCGVRLKDGTMLPYLSTGGGGGFTDESRTEFRFIHPFNHMIDLNQVDALVFLKPNAWKDAGDAERFYIVPLEN